MNNKSRNSILIIAAISAVIIVIATIPFTIQLVRPSIADDDNGNTISSSVRDQVLSAAKSQDPLRIVAVGAWDCTKESETTVKSIESRDPHLVIGLGDYSYQGDPGCWFDLVAPIDEKMKIAIGDQDREPIAMRERYLTHFLLPGEYYSFDIGKVHFLALSTEIPDQSAGSSQYRFAENDLAKASSNPELPWTIVYFHRPIYTTHPHTALSLFREVYHPLFERYGVDLILQGHNSNYQRSYPLLFNAQNPTRPEIASLGDMSGNANSTSGVPDASRYLSPKGIVFVTVGTAGHDPQDKIGTVERFIAFQDDQEHGFLELSISEHPALGSSIGTGQDVPLGNSYSRLSGTFYANSETGNQTRVVDSFSIIKKS